MFENAKNIINLLNSDAEYFSDSKSLFKQHINKICNTTDFSNFDLNDEIMEKKIIIFVPFTV